MLRPGFFIRKSENLEGIGLLHLGQVALLFMKWKNYYMLFLLQVGVRDNWMYDVAY